MLSVALRYVMALSGILNFLMPVSLAQIDPTCDFYQNMVFGQPYYIHNREYPANYIAGTSCRWTATSPPGTVIVISCEDIYLPTSTNCQLDRLAISLSGDASFKDSRNFCGIGSVTLLTTTNAIAVGLLGVAGSPGGRFVCSLTAIQSDTPTTTSEAPVTCDCGWRLQTRIVGGQETGINEFPAMSALVDTANKVLFCGASIISDRYALTAAHCFENRVLAEVALLVGDHNVTSGSDTNAAALYTIEKFIIHPKYSNRQSAVNDIAIARTASTIQFSLKVGPICLPFRYSIDDFDGQIVIALGWGVEEFSGPKSDTLQGVDLGVISNSQCASQVPENVTSSQLCTYAEDKDSCLADSGGPLYWQDPVTRRLQLVGVISKGFGCAGFLPSFNTRVTAFLTWIISVTTDAVYCIR